MKMNTTRENKIISAMKICATQGILGMIICGMSLAHTNEDQLLDKKITVEVNNVTMEATLHEIESAAQMKFAYSPDQIDLQEKISLHAINQTLRSILESLLTPRNITFKVHEKVETITLRKIATDSEQQPKAGAQKSSSQKQVSFTLTGTVASSQDKQPLAGVNILIKGTTQGTTTNADGTFSIEANEGDIITFSFIGFISFEWKVDNQTFVNILLHEDTKSLHEVVINAGYYTTTKETQTGNIGKINAVEIQKQPVSNPIAALVGRIPGLEIIQQTGVPGGNFKVRIRGTNSIANGNDPLYIIDGVPYISESQSFLETSGNILGSNGAGPLNNINPADIESIEVLKDADATAIYGSRGSNGVVLITTKKGEQGVTRVNLNIYSGVAKVPKKLDLLSRTEYLTLRNEAFSNDNMIPTSANAPDLVTWDTTRYTDWQGELIGGTASITDVQLSISGGDQRTQFSIGSGYHRETTVFPGSNSDQRLSTHVSLNNISPNQKLKSSFLLNYSYNTTNLLSRDLTERAISLSPTAPAIYDDNGNLSWVNWTTTFENPLAYLKRRYEGITTNLIANTVIDYALLPTLFLKANLGYTSNASKATSLQPISSIDPAFASNVQNQTNFSTSSFQNWIIEPQLNWKPKLGEGQFDVLIGTTFLNQTTEGLSQTASGFASESLMKNLAAATNRTPATNYFAQYRYTALFGRINYSLKDRYILNLTARRDGSSRFGPGNQFATFGAIGAAWIFSQESFMKNIHSPFSFGKIRTSFGTSGNDQLGDYKFLDAYTITGSGTYQGSSGLTPARLSNPNFAWETNTKMEAALELGFINNQLMASFSAFRNQSSNQLVGYPLPTTTGFNVIQGNFPATVQNTGLEIELSAHNRDSNPFQWSTSLNLTIPKNKLVEFQNLNDFPAYANQYVVGQPLSIAKLYNYTGLDPTTGMYTLLDVNQDGTLDNEDRQSIEFIGQQWYGGLVNDFQYRGFQLSFLFQVVKQTAYENLSGIPGAFERNQHRSVLERWQNPGDITEVPKATTQSTLESSLFSSSDQAVTDASFIRLKNISFSYSLPQSILEKIHVQNIRCYIQGQNVLTFTKYTKALDPETANTLALPPLQTITLGLHLSF